MHFVAFRIMAEAVKKLCTPRSYLAPSPFFPAKPESASHDVVPSKGARSSFTWHRKCRVPISEYTYIQFPAASIEAFREPLLGGRQGVRFLHLSLRNPAEQALLDEASLHLCPCTLRLGGAPYDISGIARHTPSKEAWCDGCFNSLAQT